MNNQDNQKDTGQQGIDQETERRNRENESGQQSDTKTDQGQTGQAGQSGSGEGGSGFVGSGAEQADDYLTETDSQDFAPEGQGAEQTDAGTADIETGQTRAPDAALDDGSDTSR